jgi:hypothetical protein
MGQVSCGLLDLALHFVKLAFDLIGSAWLHHGFSLGGIPGRNSSAIHWRKHMRLSD